jgi:hypothetical protein
MQIKKILIINLLSFLIIGKIAITAEIKDCSNLGIVEKKACQSKNVGNKIGNKMPSFLKKGFEKMKESNRELK